MTIDINSAWFLALTASVAGVFWWAFRRFVDQLMTRLASIETLLSNEIRAINVRVDEQKDKHSDLRERVTRIESHCSLYHDDTGAPRRVSPPQR